MKITNFRARRLKRDASHFFGSSTNEVRNTGSGKSYGEDIMKKDRVNCSPEETNKPTPSQGCPKRSYLNQWWPIHPQQVDRRSSCDSSAESVPSTFRARSSSSRDWFLGANAISANVVNPSALTRTRLRVQTQCRRFPARVCQQPASLIHGGIGSLT